MKKHLFIGIGGGTGSGKSTIAAEVVRRLEASCRVHLIHQDQFFKPVDQLPTFYSDYHQAPRPDFNRPDSFRVEAMVAHCTAVFGYDVVILEGILALYYPALRQLMDIKCYIDTPLEEMLIRRTERNLARGYGGPFAEIAHYNLECVTPQHQRYNLPTRRFANFIISNGLHEEGEREEAVGRLCGMIMRKIGD